MIFPLLLATALAGAPDFDARWDFADPAGTETAFRTMRPEVEKSGDLDQLLQLDTQLARTLGLQGKFDAGHRVLDGVEKRLTKRTRTAQIRCLLERGRLYLSQGDKDAAVRPFAKAWKKAQAYKLDGHAVDAGHMIAIMEGGSNGHAWNLRTLRFAQESNDPAAKKWLGSLYNNIGWDHHRIGQYDLALVAFQKGVEARQGRGRPDRVRVARWTVARTLRSLNRCDESLVILQDLQKEWAEAEVPDGYVFEELAECHLSLGKPEKAQPFFRLAYQLLQEDERLKKHEAKRLERLRVLGGQK